MSISYNKLTACQGCNKEISVEAVSCPGCGAPNKWLHPLVERFLKNKDSTGISKPFTFHHERLRVYGETEKKVPPAVKWTVVILVLVLVSAYGLMSHAVNFIFPGMFAYLGLGGAILIGLVVGGGLQLAASRNKTFDMNFATDTWTSNDDEFWRPVRQLLTGEVPSNTATLGHTPSTRGVRWWVNVIGGAVFATGALFGLVSHFLKSNGEEGEVRSTASVDSKITAILKQEGMPTANCLDISSVKVLEQYNGLIPPTRKPAVVVRTSFTCKLRDGDLEHEIFLGWVDNFAEKTMECVHHSDELMAAIRQGWEQCGDGFEVDRENNG